MAKKSKPESEQYAVEDNGSKKRKKKSTDAEKAVVKRDGTKKSEKTKKRKRQESLDAPAALEITIEGADQDVKADKTKKKKKKLKKKAAEETGGKPTGSDTADDVTALEAEVAAHDTEEPPKNKKKKKKSEASIEIPEDTTGAKKSKKDEKKSKKMKSKRLAEESMPNIEVTDGDADTVQEVVEPTPAATTPTVVNGNHAEAESGQGTDPGASQPQPKAVKNSFRRVKSEEWVGRRGSMDNTYEGTFGAGGWGFKAQQVLGQVRGKDFRHEKTKKKRGSYMGGKIDSSARFSFKYDSD